LQNSHHQRLSLFLRGAWLIIAGVLLLGHTSVLAESYIKVWENGVVNYYFSSREPPQPRQAGINTPALRQVRVKPQTRPPLPEGQAFIPKMDQDHNLRPLSIKAVIRMEAPFNSKAGSPKGGQGLSQLRLEPNDEVKVVNPDDPQANIWTGPRYLAGLLAKFGYRLLGASAADNAARRVDRHQALPPLQETQALVREVCHNFLKYAQEQHPQLGQVKPGSDPLTESNQLSYCFPVAPPFSFRDSWGDCRSRGRYHHAADIFAWEGTPVYAMTTGVIHQLAIWPEAGISLLLRGQDGYGYGYMHLQGYAEGIVEGKTVKKGELIAYVGRTGIQQSAAHLHLQVYRDHRFARDEFLNPYGLLVQLSNGQGVTDLGHPRIARRQIPAVEVINSGTVRLSGSVPLRYHGSQRSVEDASTLFIDNF